MVYLKSIEESQKRRDEYKKKYKAKSSFIWKSIYNTQQWRTIRLEKLQEQPLCECCLEKGKYTLATTVHHKTEISKGKTDDEMKEIAFDFENLQSICKECHTEHHRPTKNYFLFDETNT